MTYTSNILRTTTRAIATSLAAAAMSLTVSMGAHAQFNSYTMPTLQQMQGIADAAKRGKVAKKSRKKIRRAKTSKKAPAKPLKGILKQPGATGAKKHVKFNTKKMSKGSKYRPKHHVKSKHIKFPGKSAKKFRNASKGAKAANAAARARQANKIYKSTKAAKYAIAGTGVGAVVAVGAGMAGLDPVEMATLKATNPAEYNRRMRDLKKNPVKYVGKNIGNNTKKAVQNVGNAGKKVGCGIGNAFKKKSKRKKC